MRIKEGKGKGGRRKERRRNKRNSVEFERKKAGRKGARWRRRTEENHLCGEREQKDGRAPRRGDAPRFSTAVCNYRHWPWELNYEVNS